MAEKKNFTIENYNGTDYDTLYPETNSGQVLLDTTAQASTNLPSGKTLNDALQHITKDGGGFQIGDVLTTARTDLGDKWLLCNGQQVTQAEYPELAALFGIAPLNWAKKGTVQLSSYDTINIDKTISIASDGTSSSEMIGIGYKDSTSSSSAIYSTTFIKNFNDSSSWGEVNSYCNVEFINNNWIMYNFDESSRLSYSSKDNPTSFTKFGPKGEIQSVVYLNGQYFVSTVGSGDSSRGIYIYNSLNDSSPTFINTTYYGQLSAYGDGFIMYNDNPYIGDARNYPFIYVHANSLTETVNINLLAGGHSVLYVTSFNGKYYMNGHDWIARYNSLTSTPVKIFTTPASTNTLNMRRYTALRPVTNGEILVFANGYYMDKSEQFHKWDNNVFDGIRNDIVGSNVSFDGTRFYWAKQTASNSNTFDVYYANSVASFTLPTISSDKTYTYIKAKS